MTRSNGAVVELIDGDAVYDWAASGADLAHLALRIGESGSISVPRLAFGEVVRCDERRTRSGLRSRARARPHRRAKSAHLAINLSPDAMILRQLDALLSEIECSRLVLENHRTWRARRLRHVARTHRARLDPEIVKLDLSITAISKRIENRSLAAAILTFSREKRHGADRRAHRDRSGTRDTENTRRAARAGLPAQWKDAARRRR